MITSVLLEKYDLEVSRSLEKFHITGWGGANSKVSSAHTPWGGVHVFSS